MDFNTALKTNTSHFDFDRGLYYQKSLRRQNAFERTYLNLRETEGRVYSDETVRRLPDFFGEGALRTEWKIRKQSARRLGDYLQKKKPKHILEIGCGNGWLINHLASYVPSSFCGVDVNEQELLQAVRVSTCRSACFVYGDIFADEMTILKPDCIILASVIQYFDDLQIFISRLLDLLPTGGQLHIIDSPLYQAHEISAAKKRSDEYFAAAGSQGDYYHHHSWEVLNSFQPSFCYNPQTLINRTRRRFFHESPFPWIMISK